MSTHSPRTPGPRQRPAPARPAVAPLGVFPPQSFHELERCVEVRGWSLGAHGPRMGRLVMPRAPTKPMQSTRALVRDTFPLLRHLRKFQKIYNSEIFESLENVEKNTIFENSVIFCIFEILEIFENF